VILACERCHYYGRYVKLEDVSGVDRLDYDVVCGACRLAVDPFKDATETTRRAVGIARVLNGDDDPGVGV